MSQCPCPTHNNQLISYIQLSPESSKFLCLQCLNDYGIFVNDVINIQQAVKQPEKLLINFIQDLALQEFINNIFQFDENQFTKLQQELEKKANVILEKVTTLLNNSKAFYEKIKKAFKSFQEKIVNVTQHNEFKNVIQTFESQNKNLNASNFKTSETSLQTFYKKVTDSQKIDELSQFQWDHNKLRTDNLEFKQYTESINSMRILQQKIIQYSVNINLLPSMVLGTWLTPDILVAQSFKYRIESQIREKKNCNNLKFQLIYKGSKDGLAMNTLWDKIDGKDNLLMFFKSQSLNVFGGYSPCKWGKTINNWVQDNSVASFLFSQTNNQIFPLKADCKQHAIWSQSSSYGPYFGNGSDLSFSTSFTVSGGSPGNRYENNTGQTVQLHGTSTTILECEIYQIIFE